MKGLKFLSLCLLVLLCITQNQLQARLGDFVGDVVGETINTAADIVEAPLGIPQERYYHDGYYDNNGIYHRYHKHHRDYHNQYHHYRNYDYHNEK